MAKQSAVSKPASKRSCCDEGGHSAADNSTIQKVVIGLLVVILLGVLFISWPPGGSKAPRVHPNKTATMVELAGGDVLGSMRSGLLNSSFVSVKGVHLGDSAEAVITARGKPAFSESPEAGILNMRYEIAPNVTDMIVHIEDDKVMRIAVKEGMTPVLVNESRMEYRKEDVTRALGKPDKIYDTKYYHIFEYHPLGLEVYFKAKQMVGYGFVPPK